jgi:nucleoside-diphosphate-sugar epimerase
MKVLVTGASGYIGSAVCEALKAAGHEVAGFVRSQEKANAIRALGCEVRLGSLEDLDSLKSACGGVDGVIHAALEFTSGAGDTDRAAVATMLEALAGSGKPLIYTSGVWVLGDTGGRMLGEIARVRPPALVAWRPAVEELVLNAKDRGVAGVVLRPGMVYGRKGGALGRLFRQAREEGVVRVIGDGENHWSSVHIDDLADLYCRAAAEPAAGELFIVTGGMPQPVKKIAAAVAKVCGIEGKVEHISIEEARKTMGAIADCWAMDCRAGSTKAARFFGWTVRKPSIFDEIFSGSYLS